MSLRVVYGLDISIFKEQFVKQVLLSNSKGINVCSLPLRRDMNLPDTDINGNRRKVAIITGSNGYIPLTERIRVIMPNSVIGTSIAQRLLENIPPQVHSDPTIALGEEHERIRLVLTCRSQEKANTVFAKLRKAFPKRTLLLEYQNLDLCSMQNVEEFCTRILHRF
jgi:hypothetical protein